MNRHYLLRVKFLNKYLKNQLFVLNFVIFLNFSSQTQIEITKKDFSIFFQALLFYTIEKFKSSRYFFKLKDAELLL